MILEYTTERSWKRTRPSQMRCLVRVRLICDLPKTTALAHFLTNFVLQHPFDSSPNNQQRGKWTQSSSLDLTYSVSLHKLRTPRSWTVWIHLSQQVAWSLVMEPVAASVTCSWTLSIWRFDKTVAFTMVSRELGDLSMLHYIVIIN